MVPRRFVRLAIVDAVGRVHAHLAAPGLEDQPTRASAQHILDGGPAEDVAKECARCGGIVGINQGVDAGDHQTELLKSPKLYYFGLLPIKKPFIALEIEIGTLPSLHFHTLSPSTGAGIHRTSRSPLCSTGFRPRPRMQ